MASKKEDPKKAKPKPNSFGQFMSRRHQAMKERDGDPLRKVRSEAWTDAGENATIEQRIAAANAAEIALRKARGITDPLDLSKCASDAEHPFPCDARSIEMYRAYQTGEDDPRGQDGGTIWTMTRPVREGLDET